MEMTVAYINKKPIFLWNYISSALSIEEEIRGLNATIINRGLGKIK